MSNPTQLVKGNGEKSQWNKPIPADEITRANLQGAVLAISTVVGLVVLACLAFLPHHLHIGTPKECALSICGAAIPFASATVLAVPAIKELGEQRANAEILQEWHDQNSLPAGFGYPGDHTHTG